MNVVFGWRAITRIRCAVQLGAIGVIFTVEQPFGVLVQFMPALAESVERSEEGAGIAGVDLDRTFVSGTNFPDRVELRVIDGHEPAVFVAHAQPECFVKLQALGSGLKAVRKRADSRSDQSASSMPEKSMNA